MPSKIKLKIHPMCEAIPPMSGTEYSLLINDMREHGFRKEFPIITHNGEVLDGRHRLKAAEELGISPSTKKYTGDPANIPTFIISANTRRNLSTGQKAAAASALANIEYGGKGGKSLDPNSGLKIKLSDATKLLGVGKTMVTDYRQVQKHAPDLAEMIRLNNDGKGKPFSINAGKVEMQKRLEHEQAKKEQPFKEAQERLKDLLNQLISEKPVSESDLASLKKYITLAEIKDVGEEICRANLISEHAGIALYDLERIKKIKAKIRKAEKKNDWDAAYAFLEELKPLVDSVAYTNIKSDISFGEDIANGKFRDRDRSTPEYDDINPQGFEEEPVSASEEMTIAEALEIFGIAGAYSPAPFAITAIYRFLAGKNHPDKGGDAAEMSLINEAKSILTK